MKKQTIMPRTRNCLRSTVRRPFRKNCRAAVRTRWRSPDDLAAALTAYRQAIRAHRRLARLAPRFFDSVVVERERRWREDQRRWIAQWEPALAKVYGTEPEPYDPTPDLPVPPSSPRTIRAVDRELAAWDFWLSAAQLAMDRYNQRRPHDLMSFSRIARLLQISMDLSQLALGIDPENPNPQPDNHEQAWADLKRGYGHLVTCTLDEAGLPEPFQASAAQQAEVGPCESIAPSARTIPSAAPHGAGEFATPMVGPATPKPAAPSVNPEPPMSFGGVGPPSNGSPPQWEPPTRRDVRSTHARFQREAARRAHS
jgi:hypothetical protein